MPIVNLYNNNIRGNIGFFGTPLETNLFNVIAPTTTPGAGGTVVSTLPSTYGSTFSTWNSQTGGWSNWNPNSSIISPTSKVEYACLIWSTAYYPPTLPQQEILANTLPITLIKPDGSSYVVTPNPSYNLNFNAGWWQVTHGADITSIMTDNQYGNYTVLGIPTGKLGRPAPELVAGAWGIYIVYSDPSYPYRSINLNVGATGFNQTFTVPNLILPTTGPVNVHVYLESVQGDAGAIYPDSLLLNGTTLSGPFNPANDFMNSKFVDYTGAALQTVGSLMVQGVGSEYASYADQTVVINNTALTNSDTQAVLRQVNSSDWAGVSQVGLMIDLLAANLVQVKSVDKPNAIAGDTITYTVTIINNGTTNANNITFIDTLPSGVTFVTNSLIINGTSTPGNVTTGITLPSLTPNATDTIVFQVKLPTNTIVGATYNNFTTSNYTFNLTPTSIINNVGVSNIITTTIVGPLLITNKTIDKPDAIVGDTITYTIILTNNTLNTLTNATFIDTIPSGTNFVNGSLRINGISSKQSPNPPGATLPNLPSGANTITFSVVINTASTPNSITNTAYITGNIGASIANISTNTAITNLAKVSQTKFASKTSLLPGEIVTYTIRVDNTNSTTTITNVYVYDNLQTGTSYVANSTVIGSNPSINANPNIYPGVLVGDIIAGGSKTVTFNVLVDTLVSSGTISNSANISFNVGTSSATYTTPQTNISVLTQGTSIVKGSNLTTSKIGDTVTYTITITNTGSINITNIIVNDPPPVNTSFISGSFLINGSAYPSLNPNNLINFNSVPVVPTPFPLLPLNSVTLAYSVLVSSLPSPPILNNVATISYSYISNGNTSTSTQGSNKSSVSIANISVVKNSSVNYAQAGDTISYSNIITNTGNTTISNIVFTDPPPSNTTYVNQSFKINGISFPSVNPNSPVAIGSLLPTYFPFYPNQGFNVQYSVVVNTIPTVPQISNISNIGYSYLNNSAISNSSTISNNSIVGVRDGKLVITKSSDKTVVTTGETITYTLSILNTGNIPVDNVIVTDTLPSNVTFVIGSVVVNNTPMPTLNPNNEMNIGTVNALSQETITFKAVATSKYQTDNISNTANARYSVLVDPNLPAIVESTISNTINIKSLLLSVTIVKSCSPSIVNISDTISYKFFIFNNGAVDINDLIFFDVLPSEVTFVNGSFIGASTNVVASDLISGVDIGSLPIGTFKNVSFEAVLNSLNCQFSLSNSSKLNYNYYLQSSTLSTGSSQSNICKIEIESNNFKQTFKDGIFILPVSAPDIENISDLTVTTSIVNIEYIDSPTGTSMEGQILSGKKMVVCALMLLKLEYVALVNTQTVNIQNYQVSTCDYIVVQNISNTTCNRNIVIEDIYFEKINSRKFFYTITYLIQ